MRSCPDRAYILAFFAPPPPLSDENPVMLHFFAYAEIIFAHILVFPACAIEVQHIDENSPTMLLRSTLGERFVIFGDPVVDGIPVHARREDSRFLVTWTSDVQNLRHFE